MRRENSLPCGYSGKHIAKTPFPAVTVANVSQKHPSLQFQQQTHCENSLPCSYSGKCIMNSSFVAFILFTSDFQVQY